MKSIRSNKLYRLFLLLSKKRKNQICFFIFLIILNGIIESLSISTIIPFLSLIISKPSKFESSILSRYLDINNFDQSLYLITILFCIFIIFSTFIRIFNNWYILRLTAKIDIELGNLIFKNNIYQSYEKYTKKKFLQNNFFSN